MTTPDAYTVPFVNIVRMKFFFRYLAKSSSTSTMKALALTARREFFDGRMESRKIKSDFGEDVVDSCMRKARKMCLAIAKKSSERDCKENSEKNCKENSDMNRKTNSKNKTCVICMERPTNTCLVHGKTAHKCVCSFCAMKLALQPMGKAVCPLCRESISLVAKSTKRSECVCGESCGRYLAISREASVESHKCTLGATYTRKAQVVRLFT